MVLNNQVAVGAVNSQIKEPHWSRGVRRTVDPGTVGFFAGSGSLDMLSPLDLHEIIDKPGGFSASA